MANSNETRSAVKDAILAVLRDATVGALGGLVGTWVMPKVVKPLFRLESKDKQHREKRIRPKPTFRVLADKLDAQLDLELDEEDAEQLGRTLHWGYGLGWGAMYGIARRRIPAASKWFGLPFAVVFSIVGDEVMNTALGLTPPPQEFPVATHLRGLAGHVAFTASTEATARTLEHLEARNR